MKTQLTIFFCIFIAISCFANGGTIDASFFRKTKNIQLIRKADISLLKEDLQLKIVGDYTIVKVKYTLKNNGNEDEILYGFPVDGFERSYGDHGDKNPFNETYTRDTADLMVHYFRAKENGKDLKIIDWVAENVYKAKYHRRDLQIYRKWYVLKMTFKKDETKTIDIEYKVNNCKHDWIQGFKYVHDFSNRKFMYDLSPSSNWGDGKVGEFKLDIDLSDISNAELDFDISGIEGLVNEGERYTLHSFDYDLNQSERINITYDPNHQKITYFMNGEMLPKRFVKRISASSNSSLTKNLLDNDPSTYWYGKVGDWIEIEFNEIPRIDTTYRKYKKLEGLMSLNGNYTNHLAFMNNGKMMKCEIMMNDSIIYNTIPWTYIDPVINIPKPQFRSLRDMKGNAVVIGEGDPFRRKGSSRFSLHKIRFTILSIEEGVSMNGNCAISELYLLGG
ncbi:MAG: hypothetical protein ACI94Y_000786 [Maribacter sp.]|jgi:hypothetical protein